ncbi:MAG: 5-hydroxyisourate hydrolase [Deltaproteobacteria bacterium]|nr:5-hydroxyisourate hydrolase [Deltaproteobacteria bacterium]
MITTHVLDTATGRPGGGIAIELERAGAGSDWALIGSGVTDDDGRLRTLTPSALDAGTYRIRFHTGPYFAATGRPAFFPVVEIQFTVETGQHYHVPLLVSPYGYTTYRGS